MSKRHDSIGVKQIIPYEWMRKAANFVLAGMNAKEIRHELHNGLAAEGRNIQPGERSAWTRTFLVNNLMAMWPSPAVELVVFRDLALQALQKHPDQELTIQWAMISAAYPFWFNTARQAGRLLNLQTRVTQAQIVNRLKEQYGDRQTVSRYARFVVRSFVDWGILRDAAVAGSYEKAEPEIVSDRDMIALLVYATLLAMPEGKAPRSMLLNNPGLFPFCLPAIQGESLLGLSDHFKVVRYGLDDELVVLST
ncbi:MAG: hypothetical protein E5V63_01135 [Mesorhizobium sp.]|nr:MAG: hypothetical protein E5V63_01135 [Mesorhizobium sp.]